MNLQCMPYDLSVCKVRALSSSDLSQPFFFIGKTDEELSLVCETRFAPQDPITREDGWKCFRIQGMLDFSLVGVLAQLTGVLSHKGVGIFAVSTYNTDYILVKKHQFDQALTALQEAGYTLIK